MLVPLDGGATSRSQELWLDFPHRRAIALKNVDDAFTATTLDDLVNVVVRAIEYDGEWPVIGGIHGTTLSTSRLLEIGKKVRGKCRTSEYLNRTIKPSSIADGGSNRWQTMEHYLSF